MVVRWKHVSYLLYGKYWKKFYSLFTLILHWIKLENFVMQLKRRSIDALQKKSIFQKRVIKPARTQSQDEKFSNQSTKWSTKVSSGHNICCLCSFLAPRGYLSCFWVWIFSWKPFFGGVRFAIWTSQFWGIKSFSTCHFCLIQFCSTSKIVSYYQIYD